MTVMLKKCRHGRTHDDALALVEYLMARGGKVDKTNEAIAVDLGMLKNLGGGMRKVDLPRFQQARHHMQDGTDNNKPCCGYRLHYRASGRAGSELTLIDPTGDLGPHANAAIESIRGWISREAQHHTENQRQIETWERLGDHALAGRRCRVVARAALQVSAQSGLAEGLSRNPPRTLGLSTVRDRQPVTARWRNARGADEIR